MSQIEQNTEDLNLILKMIKDMPAGEFYDGIYTVTPSSSKQVIDTTNKLLKADLVVEKIPYREVVDKNGGKAIIIGKGGI